MAFYFILILKIFNGFSILVITDGHTKLLRNSEKLGICNNTIFL